ncbi:MAG: hypothetical protein ACE5HB_05840 [Terriglobia bacterium]
MSFWQMLVWWGQMKLSRLLRRLGDRLKAVGFRLENWGYRLGNPIDDLDYFLRRERRRKAA